MQATSCLRSVIRNSVQELASTGRPVFSRTGKRPKSSRQLSTAVAASLQEPSKGLPLSQNDPPLSRTLPSSAQSRREAIRNAPSFSEFLTDSFNRQHTYLRISVTERCNLRCLYCMPAEGVALSPPSHLLTTPEIVYLASLFVSQGVTKIRLTGGEPTVRKDIVTLMQRLGDLRSKGLKEIGITTNGLLLHRHLDAMVEAGLTGINMSLDTLDPFQFQIMTRRKGFDAVMRSIDRVLEMKKRGVDLKLKINCVVMRGMNDREILDFVELTKEKDIEVRFIEYMPFGGNKWTQNKMFSFQEMVDRIREKYPGLHRVPGHKNDTSKTFAIPGFMGRVGFITSMTNDFCGTCNRLRITNDGNLKVCLHGNAEVSLRDVLREGNSGQPIDQEAFERIRQQEMERSSGAFDDITPLGWGARERNLLSVIGGAVKRKKEKHAGMGQLENMENRPMILIGGRHPASSSIISKSRRRHPIRPSVAAPWSHIPLHVLAGASSPTVRCASTAPTAPSHSSKVSSRVSPEIQEAPDAAEDTFASTKAFLSHLAVHDRRRVLGTIRKVAKNIEHIEKMVLPGFRRQIFCVIQHVDDVSAWPASAITPKRLRTAIVRRAKRMVDHVDNVILPGLRREVYSAITGIPAPEFAAFNPDTKRLNELLAKRKSGLLAEELPLEMERVDSLRRSAAWRRKQDALRKWEEELMEEEVNVNKVNDRTREEKHKDGNRSAEESRIASVRQLTLSGNPRTKYRERNAIKINGSNWGFKNPRASIGRSISTTTSSTSASQAPSHLPHLTSDGSAHMVDVKDKEHTHRVAVAIGRVVFGVPGTHKLISDSLVKKGDVLGTARVAGIMAAKNCPALVPLCHPIALSSVAVDVKLLPPNTAMGKRQASDDHTEGISLQDVDEKTDAMHSKLLRFHQSQKQRIDATRKEIVTMTERLRVTERAVNTYIDELRESYEGELLEPTEAKTLGDLEKDGESKRFKRFKTIQEASYVVQRVCKALNEAAEMAMKELATRTEINEEFRVKASEAVEQVNTVGPPQESRSEQSVEEYGSVRIEAKVECVGPTGVEMEALTSVSAAALTVIDMIKAADRNARVEGVKMVMKKGGRSGLHVDEKWLKDPHRVYQVK